MPLTAGPASATALLRDITELRRAGDTAGAMALADHWRAGAHDGAGPPSAAEADLFRSVALDPSLGPALFRHLVDRFGWRDPAAPAAQADPEAHAVLLRRLDAEDWFATLQDAAARPGHPAGLAFGHPAAAPLDAAGRDAARAIIAALLRRGDILLDRLDGEHLAALRAAVEGPPDRVTLPPPGKPFPTSRFGAFRHRIGWSGQAFVVLLVGAIGMEAWNSGLFRHAPTPQEQARSILASTADRWAEFRQDARGTIVYFSQLTSWRAGLRAVRYGLDTEQPDRTLPLAPPGAGDDVGALVQAPAGLRLVSVQLTWFDGTTSPVRVFRVDGGGR